MTWPRRLKSNPQSKVGKEKGRQTMVISPNLHCAGVTPTQGVQVTHVLHPVSVPLISRPQTKIDVWLANLSADVLISGTYVRPLFVMQLRANGSAFCFELHYCTRTKSKRWGWVIISCCLWGPFTYQGPCVHSQRGTKEMLVFFKLATCILSHLLFLFAVKDDLDSLLTSLR